MEAFEVKSGFLRGGNTFVFDAEALLGLPNVAPNVNGRPTRRSDMIWALLQERRLRRKVYSVRRAVFLNGDRQYLKWAEIQFKTDGRI